MVKVKRTPPVLPAPERNERVPSTAKWLSGQGAGSWFVIQSTEENKVYHIQRLSPEGELECEGNFRASESIDLSIDYEVTYPSHCAVVTVKQEGKLTELARI
ncbi:DUF6695 family protein [Parvicella tangerina]|uniref:DUF6695 domain-containing protein n=1 Tax=Parvicella tangerina TaxID=2829795 RepID=A0A916N9H3_9FLAO|nr:DUF6695 family protein [Parvicella tangerina]CAG5077161.1 hypothetical protein CRYO30217_00306 [Parvicella tangerina]